MTNCFCKDNFILPFVEKFLNHTEKHILNTACYTEHRTDYRFFDHNIFTMNWACEYGAADIVQLLGHRFLTHQAILGACLNSQYEIVDIIAKNFEDFKAMFANIKSTVFEHIVKNDDADMLALLVYHGENSIQFIIPYIKLYGSIKILHYILFNPAAINYILPLNEFVEIMYYSVRNGFLNILQLLARFDRITVKLMAKKLIVEAIDNKQIKMYYYLQNEFSEEI